MSRTTTTVLMGLVLPIPGPTGELGPTWATELITAFNFLDSHNHAPGSGARVTPAGINVNADLDINNFNLLTVYSSRYVNQTAALSGSTDKRCVYSVNGDLYWNNSGGTAVQITAGGAINIASVGTITGDYSTTGANVSYSNTTKSYAFLQGTPNTSAAANLITGNISLLEPVTGGVGITLKVPTGFSGAYDIVFPTALPSVTMPLQLSTSGQLSAVQIVTNQITDLNVTAAKLAADAVETLKILDGNVTRAKLGTDISLTPDSTTFTSNGTFTVPDNVYWLEVAGCGGGGGGGGGHNGIYTGSGVGWLFGGGGGGGGAAPYATYKVPVIPGHIYNCEIGVAGNGGSVNATGGSGGISYFYRQGTSVPLVVFPGGAGGIVGGVGSGSIGGAGGTGGQGCGFGFALSGERGSGGTAGGGGYAAGDGGNSGYGAGAGGGGGGVQTYGDGGAGGGHTQYLVSSGGSGSKNAGSGGGGGSNYYGYGATGGNGGNFIYGDHATVGAAAAYNGCGGGGGGGGCADPLPSYAAAGGNGCVGIITISWPALR